MENIQAKLNTIIDELRDYQQSYRNGKDGWADTFYNGIEYSIDVLVDACDNNDMTKG